MSERSTGILLHITSLPSAFGIGDLGPQAYAFADALKRADQKYWQILPLNLVDAGANFSPYSSLSGMAGNVLLISPELLVKDGLIEDEDPGKFYLRGSAKVDFAKALATKQKLFSLAWRNFLSAKPKKLERLFNEFCNQEKYWLDDFTLFSVIKKHQKQKPWFYWPADLKNRKREALKRISEMYADDINQLKFLQFLFSRQWQQLRNYCRKNGLTILGDLPYYVSHDSADVWTNREIFKIDDEGKPIAMAGTPPDLFTDEGQLWNMPVYDWKILKKKNYSWWVQRIKQNQKFFDLVRLDHFRGFSAFWEVPADATSARKGSWKTGPTTSLFTTIRKKLGDLPFVAEDLGEIDDAVIQLRDQFDLPGMKVLQFAFGKNLPASEHIPHNYGSNFFVFTGTHDNNTTRGWWKAEIDQNTRERINNYCNKEIREETIAWEMIRLAYSSVAKVAIIPMQDILNLDASARMNVPGLNQGNWSWRMLPGQFNTEIEKKIAKWVKLFGRRS